jgi:hypothetical protein
MQAAWTSPTEAQHRRPPGDPGGEVSSRLSNSTMSARSVLGSLSDQDW